MQSLTTFWRAVAAVDPKNGDLDEGTRFPLCRPETLRTAWLGAGLVDVAVEPLEVRRGFGSFDELWRPFLGGQGAAGGLIATLAPAHRNTIGKEFEARLPIEPDGSLSLTARAWAVRGRCIGAAVARRASCPAGPHRASTSSGGLKHPPDGHDRHV